MKGETEKPEIEIGFCQLCKRNPANQTGSHIIPYSLLRHIFNEPGKKGRGAETAFDLSSNESAAFLGRSILPDKIQKLHDEFGDFIEQEEDFFTQDYILCSDCETRLGTIESFFADKVLNYLIKDNQHIKSGPTFSVIKAPTEIIRLYVYSIFWRISICPQAKNPLKLERKLEEELRVILHRNLAFKVAELLKNSINDSRKIKSFPLAIIHADSPESHEDNFVLANPFLKRPYVVFVDSFLFFLYAKESHTIAPTPHLFAIPNHVNFKSFINIHESNFSFGKLNNHAWESIQDSIFFERASKKLDKIKREFITAFEKSMRFPAPYFMTQYYVNCVLDAGSNTPETRLNAIKATIKHFYKIEF